MNRRKFIYKGMISVAGIFLGGHALSKPCSPRGLDIEGTHIPAIPSQDCHSNKPQEPIGLTVLSVAANSLMPGQFLDFNEGRNSLTRYLPEISWQSITFYYDPIRREAQYMGKPQSGRSKNHQHYIYHEKTNTWETTGQELFPSLGHIWTSAFDYKTGDYFYQPYGHEFFYWMERESKTWTKTTTFKGMLSGANILNGASFHPNLFGPNDGGLVCQSHSRIMAWRKSNSTWSVLATGNYGKAGHGTYLPEADIVIIGSGAYDGFLGSLYSIEAGSNGEADGLITELGRPPVIVAGSGGGTIRGKILVDPSDPNILLLLETYGSGRVWTSSSFGRNWEAKSYRHPFDGLYSATGNGFTATSVGSYGVIWGITSSRADSSLTARLWKPPMS